MTESVNILLVDDEPGMLRYIRTCQVDDYTVQTEASRGEEAPCSKWRRVCVPTWCCSTKC